MINIDCLYLLLKMNSQRFDPEARFLQQKLRTIFTYYCCFGDRDNFSILKVQNYRRMLLDAQLLEDPADHPHLDLIYATYRSQTGVTFQDFLTLLPEVLDFLNYPNIEIVINNNFHALYEYILENTQFGQCVTALQKERFSEGCFLLLKELSPTLQRIYIHYYDPFKLKNNREHFKSLTNFTREFQITPQLITITHSYIIYQFLEEEESPPAYKQWFTLQSGTNAHQNFYFKFIEYLVLVGSLAGRKIYGVEMSPVKKLATFMEMLEISKGFSKLCKLEKIKLHLIASDALIKKIDQDPAETLQNITNRSSPTRREAKFSLETDFSSNYSALKKKFVSLCIQGQTIGQNHLTHKKVIDIFRQMNIGLEQSQVELLLAQVGEKTIDFQLFIDMLQRIQEKEGLNSIQLCSSFLDIPLNQNFYADQLRTSRIHPQFKRQEYKKCLSMIEAVDILFSLIFRMNCQPNRQADSQLAFLTLPTYLKIMYDFEISPLYLSKSSLVEIFKISIKKSEDFMDQAEFKDSFIIALPYIQETNAPEMDQRLVLILEQMNESRGTHKIAKKFPYDCKEDYLAIFRSTFSQNYKIQNEEKGRKEKRKRGFNLSRRI